MLTVSPIGGKCQASTYTSAPGPGAPVDWRGRSVFLMAEAAAKRVVGVSGIANDVEVRVPSVDERPDPDVARDAVTAIKSQLPISSDQIRVVVKNGWVNLEGQTEWQYQRQTAENAVRRIKGVKGVNDQIQLKPRAVPSEIERRIQHAFERNAQLDANR